MAWSAVSKTFATVVAVSLIVNCFSLPALATQKWSDAPYNYVVLDQDVRTALTEFGRNLELPVVLSDAVSGRVGGRIEARNAGEFMERLAITNGLTWYFDGYVLYVSADREFITRVLGVGRLSGEAIVKQMRDLGLFDERFSLRIGPNGNVITVSGPPAYINVVSELVARMQPEPRVAGDDPRVRVFRGGLMTEVVAARPADSGQTAATENAGSQIKRVSQP